MANEIQFEAANMNIMQQYASLEKQIKKLEEVQKGAREILQREMEKHGVRSIDNEFVKITLVPVSVSTTLDTKLLRAERPELYGMLLRRYEKTTEKKSHVRVKVK